MILFDINLKKSRIIKEQILLEQLKIFSTKDIFYCLWKNLDNYKLNSNPNDLDIYVKPADSERAFRLLDESGWIRLINPVANYKRIRHYYFFTFSCTYHLHIYSGLRTGDSWLKNYYFSLDNFILDNSYYDENNINILNNEAFHLIFNLRILLKNSTFIGRLLYRSSLEKYKNETYLIDYDKINYYYSGYLEKQIKEFVSSIKGANIFYNNIPGIFSCQRLTSSLNKYSLINIRTKFLRQFISLIIRVLNKVIFRFNKILYNNSKIITIYGSDGSGKSTLVNNLVKIYKPYFPCSSAHLGKPFQSNKFFNDLYTNQDSFKILNQKNNKNFNFSSGFKSLILSLLRLTSSNYQFLKKVLGITVITDRWPSESPNSMDGPKIFDNSKKRFVIYIFNFLNSFIYKIMPSSDLIIILETDLNEIIKRNAKRDKPEKKEYIISRYHLQGNSKPKSKKFLYYKNNKNLEYAIDDCLKICAKCLKEK